MIGGTDVIIPTRAHPAASLDFCLRTILKDWPQAVLEDALTGEIFDDYNSASLRDRSELFVFRDKAVAREWEARGAEPGLENTMIHILLSDGHLTLVVDDPSEASVNGILNAVRDGLRNEALNGPAEPASVPLQSRQANSPDATSQSGPK